MGVALLVVPGIALAYLWVAPARPGRLAALRPAPGRRRGAGRGRAGLAAARDADPGGRPPWISGTADNSIWSLIFNYNGVGPRRRPDRRPRRRRSAVVVAAAARSAAPPAPFRLLQSGLGDQAGWLLGFAIVAGLGLLVATRLRRARPAHRLADRRRRRVRCHARSCSATPRASSTPTTSRSWPRSPPRSIGAGVGEALSGPAGRAAASRRWRSSPARSPSSSCSAHLTGRCPGRRRWSSPARSSASSRCALAPRRRGSVAGWSRGARGAVRRARRPGRPRRSATPPAPPSRPAARPAPVSAARAGAGPAGSASTARGRVRASGLVPAPAASRRPQASRHPAAVQQAAAQQAVAQRAVAQRAAARRRPGPVRVGQPGPAPDLRRPGSTGTGLARRLHP